MSIVFIHPTEKHSSILLNEEHQIVNYNVNIDLVNTTPEMIDTTLLQITQQMLDLVPGSRVVMIIPFEDKRSVYERLSEQYGIIFYRYKKTMTFTLKGKLTSPRTYSMFLPG